MDPSMDVSPKPHFFENPEKQGARAKTLS